jgi:enterochelin esterase-like enzyme
VTGGPQRPAGADPAAGAAPGGSSVRHGIVALLCVLLAQGTPAMDLAAFLAGLERAPLPSRQARVDSLLDALPGGAAPLVEEGAVHILYSGPGRSLELAGDWTGWRPVPLRHVAGTSLWLRTERFPDLARLDYKLIRDGAWILDPLNPATCAGGFGPNSELALSGFVQPPEIRDHGLPPCRIETHPDVASEKLGSRRTVKVVLPPGYDGRTPHPCLVVHDGLEYIDLAHLPRVLAWLAARAPEMRLPVCVCVPPVAREEEYVTDLQTAFGEFIVGTVLPLVRERYALEDDPRWWGSMGASNGGNVSLYLAGAYPDRFRTVVAMSSVVAPGVGDLILAQPPGTYRIYLNWGTYDIPPLIPRCEEFARELSRRGVAHAARVYPEGHSWGLWRHTIDEGLAFVFGPADP